MNILALDIAEYRTGWAMGAAGMLPKVGTALIREKGQTTEDAIVGFAKWLAETLDFAEVDLVAAEQYIPHGAALITTAATRDAAILFNGAMRGLCAVRSIPVRCPAVSTIRKHFVKNGRADKSMVLKQAKLLGYLPPSCADTDQSDAVALWDFASSHWGRKAAAFQLA